MAEPPGSEGRANRPPPVPRRSRGGTGAPPRGKAAEDAVQAEESTQRVAAPHEGALVDEVAELLAAEAEALLSAGDKHDDALADLNLRLAILSLDVSDDAAAAARYLELAERHPLALRFALAQGMAGSGDDLDRVQSRIEALPAGPERAATLRDLAEAWLYRLASPARAVDAAHKAAAGASPELAAELHQLSITSLGLAGETVELARALAEGSAASLATKAEAARLWFDVAHDAAAAAERLAPCLAASGELGAYATELGLELLAADPELSSLDLGQVLTRRLAILGDDAGGAREAQATRYLLGVHQAELGDLEGATQNLTKLTGAGEGDAAAWGARLALLTRLRFLVAREQWRDVATSLLELGEQPGAGKLAMAAYRRRAAELFDSRADARDRALELWKQIYAHTGDAEAERAVERLSWADFPALVAHLENVARRDKRRAASALRRAAAVAEGRSQDVPSAIRLRRAALAADGDGAAVRHDDLARLLRLAGDRVRLADFYRELAALHGGDPRGERSACVYLWAAGVLELVKPGRERAAEESLLAAARRAPRDLGTRALLATLYRRTGKNRELAAMLSELAAIATHQVTRYDVLRELGDVCGNVLGDSARARAALEEALLLRPNEAEVLHALARLYDQSRDFGKAIELRRRAVGGLSDGGRAASLWLEIGQLEETQRGDDAAGLAAFQQAHELEPRSIPALQALARLHRKAQRFAPLLEVLRKERASSTQPERILPLCLEIAQLSSQLGESPDQVLAAYREALAVDRKHEQALRGLETVASQAGRWDVIVEAFRAAPESSTNLRALANALGQLKTWPEVAEVRLKQINLAAGKGEKAELSRSLGELYEQQLADVEGAIRMYGKALTFEPTDLASQRALTRLLESNGRHRELCAAFERELTIVASDDVERQVALLLRIGELRRTHLAKLPEAAQAYEAVIERRPKHAAALDVLEDLYSKLNRSRELLRVLELKAELAERPTDRAGLAGRIGAIRERTNDIDGAIDAYRKAFAAEPDSRETFTVLEALCYRHERWAPVMDLYATVIKRVEGGSRAYRLADLYARRGQVLMQYLAEPAEAARSFSRVLELEPDNDEAMTALESIYAGQQDWRGLLGAHERRAGQTRDPARKKASLLAAARVASQQLGHPGEPVRLYGAVLELAPGDPEALGFLERHHEKEGRWDLLVDVLLARVAALPPGEDAVPLLLRASQICEEGLRDDDRAIETYGRILELAPENKQALEALGRIYESTERWSDFVDVTRRQIKVTSDRNVKALLYFKCGSVMEAKFSKEDDAIRYYDAAIKTSPACLPAVHGLRDLYRRRMDWPRVIQTLELEVKLWQDDKERAGVFAQIGRLYAEELHEPDRAMHYFESALAVDPDCVPANKALFDQFFAHEEWDRALPLAQALAQKAMRDGDPDARSDFFRKRGVVAWRSGDPRSAAESIIISLEIKPTNLEALEALGQLSRAQPEAYDFAGTYRELEKIYRKRDDAQALFARVLTAQASFLEREGDLDGAEKLYAEATRRCPGDFNVLSAQVDLHVAMRRWSHAIDDIVRFLEGQPPPSPEVRVQALMRQAEIHADCEMDAHRAIRVLTETIRFDETVGEAYYLLAQEYFALGRFGDARAALERVIELAAAPGSTLQPEKLARYYYYLGRIIEASGDIRASTSHYRRAAEYDPGYAPPALALAMRAADGGDQQTAETLLIDAAHAAMQRGGERAAVPMQRGLARILLSSSDRPAAIEAYRGILAVEPGNADDRIALAEIYAHDDLPKAIEEVKQVIQRDLRHAAAYRLLASYHARSGETDRAARVLIAMECLGYADDLERRAAAKAVAEQSLAPLRQPLSDELRRRLLLTRQATSPLGELFDAVAEQVAALYPEPPVGVNLVALQGMSDEGLRVAAIDTARLFGIEPEIYVGEHVPRGVVALTFPRPVVVLDRSVLGESDAAKRFALGWAFEAIRGRYALLHGLGRRQRAELGTLLKSLLLPEAERPQLANDFARALPRAAQRVLERYQGTTRYVDTEEWIDGMLASARRAGLFACDDFAAGLRVIARLRGESVGVGQEAIAALGVVICGEDLVRFYLSDEYHRLRESLSRVLPGPA